MEHRFWHKKWETNELGFHQDDFNPVLVRHWAGLDIPGGSKVFVPMCGKSKDMLWLAGQGYDVIGVELSEIARAHFSKNTVWMQRGAKSDRLSATSRITSGYIMEISFY